MEDSSAKPLRLFVVIATIGRPEVVCDTVTWLERQTRRADGVVVASVSPKDVAGLDTLPNPPEIVFSGKGLCTQRNRALDALAGRADLIVFFDDDFVPAHDYLAEIEADFLRDPHLVGATGRLIADGIHNEGYTFSEAVRLVEEDRSPSVPTDCPIESLYGCNMTIRLVAAEGLRFDEALPLYGWLEDVDFTYRLRQRGRLTRSQRYAGVHMGVKGGRTSGRKLGYSQIANPTYLLKKKTVPPSLAWQLMGQNLLSNVVRSLRPEQHIDRRGRLMGNLAAIADLMRRRVDPRRILDMR